MSSSCAWASRFLAFPLFTIALGSGLLPAFAPLPLKDERTPEQIQAAQDDLSRLRRLAGEPKTKPDLLWKLWQEFRVKHPGSPEWTKAAAIMAKIPSPLDKLDRNQIPPEDRPEWLPKEVVAVLGENRGRHWGAIEEVFYSGDERYVISQGKDGLRVWDAQTLREIDATPGITLAKLLPDGKTLIVAKSYREFPKKGELVEYGTLLVYELRHGRLVKKMLSDQRMSPWPMSLAATADGGLVAIWGHIPLAAGRHGQPTESIWLWDMRGDAPRLRAAVPTVHSNWGPSRVALALDGKLLLDNSSTGSGKRGHLRIWDITGANWKLLGTVDDPGRFAVSPDGKRLATQSTRGKAVQLWTLTDTGIRPLASLEGNFELLSGLAFSADGDSLALTLAGEPSRVCVYPVTEARRKNYQLPPRAQYLEFEVPLRPTSVGLSADGRKLVIGCVCAVRQWELPACKEIGPSTGHSDLFEAADLRPIAER